MSAASLPDSVALDTSIDRVSTFHFHCRDTHFHFFPIDTSIDRVSTFHFFPVYFHFPFLFWHWHFHQQGEHISLFPCSLSFFYFATDTSIDRVSTFHFFPVLFPFLFCHWHFHWQCENLSLSLYLHCRDTHFHFPFFIFAIFSCTFCCSMTEWYVSINIPMLVPYNDIYARGILSHILCLINYHEDKYMWHKEERISFPKKSGRPFS